MRVIQIPEKLASVVNCMPEGLVEKTLTRFPKSSKRTAYRKYKGKYKGLKGLLATYSDSYLQTLIRVLYDDKSPEYCYRDFLYHTIPFSRYEVKLESGVVDVMTNTHTIEVKKAQGWKHALGQAQSYAFETGLLPAVALYGDIPEIAKATLGYYQVDLIELP